jgi:hypothetical protein
MMGRTVLLIRIKCHLQPTGSLFLYTHCKCTIQVIWEFLDNAVINIINTIVPPYSFGSHDIRVEFGTLAILFLNGNPSGKNFRLWRSAWTDHF